MDILTQNLLDVAKNDFYITVGQHKETYLYHGLLYVNHPTPSGSDRYILALSDKRCWENEEKAIEKFKDLLKAKNIVNIAE